MLHRLRALALGLFGLALSPGIAHAEEPSPSPFVPPGYKLVWNDEFDGTKLDETKWGVRYPGPREAGFVSPDAVSLDGQGHILLTTKEQDGKLLNGHLGTDRTFTRAFGYFESRLKFEQQRGQHGCFWLQSNAKRIPGDPKGSGVEVDIAEYFGPARKDSGLGVNVYWLDAAGKNKREGGIVDLAPVFHGQKPAPLGTDFHTYGLLWTPDQYTMSVDGHQVFHTKEGVSHQPAFIVVSLFTASWEVAYLDRKHLPDSMVIDYVRVYSAP